MPFAFKLLQSKNVSLTFDTLYKVGVTKDPNAVSAIVSNIRVYNKAVASATITLIVQSSAGAGKIILADDDGFATGTGLDGNGGKVTLKPGIGNIVANIVADNPNPGIPMATNGFNATGSLQSHQRWK